MYHRTHRILRIKFIVFVISNCRFLTEHRANENTWLFVRMVTVSHVQFRNADIRKALKRQQKVMRVEINLRIMRKCKYIVLNEMPRK